MKIIVGVTGASGAMYARLLLEKLAACEAVGRIALIVTRNGQAVSDYEGQPLPEHSKITRYGIDDMFAPPASGSACWDAMVVVPCSMGSLGRIAHGVSADLLGRAADVMLKERRRLILVPRETPLSTVHLRNMTALSECGAIIVPACPSFYSHPETMETLCGTVTDRILLLLGLDPHGFRWGE